MTSLASRNFGRLVPRLIKAVDRQRHVSRLAPFSVNQQNQCIVLSTQDFMRHASSLVAPIEEDDKSSSTVAQARQKRKNINFVENVDRILYTLDLAVRKRGRVMKHDLDKIIGAVMRTGECTSNQALLIIKCGGEVLVDIDRRTRSDLTEKHFNLLLGLKDTPLDISHFNALLKVHLENNKEVNVNEFLAMLDEKNLGPNRVTYQHCVSLFCQQGDIAGATAILQHMKQQDMAINEAVFHSLLIAHCANKDTEAVASTLEILTNTGIGIGAEAYTVMAVSYAKSGQWDMVLDTLKTAEEAGISFDDADIFSVILACTDGGLHEQSETLIEKLPMKRGYFQEVRNTTPQLALEGNIATAIKLYTQLKNRQNFDKSGEGQFLVVAIANSKADLETIVSAVLQLEDSGYDSAIQFLAQEAAWSYSLEKCQQLSEIIQSRRPEHKINHDLQYTFVRSHKSRGASVDQVVSWLSKLHVLRQKIPDAIISSDVIPMCFDGKKAAVDVIKELRSGIPNLSFPYLYNQTLRYLLNQQGSNSQQGLKDATGLVLNIVSNFQPDKWNASLARAYLITNDVECFTSILASACLNTLEFNSTKPSDLVRKLHHLFASLTHVGRQGHIHRPGVSEDELLSPLLQALIDIKIGVPSDIDTNTELKTYLKSAEAKALLEEAWKVWDENKGSWTKENAEALRTQQKKEMIEKFGKQRKPQSELGRYKDFKQIEDQQTLENIQEILVKEKKMDATIGGKLLGIYLSQGDIAKAMPLKQYCEENSEDFTISPTSLKLYLEQLIKMGNIDDLKNALLKEVVEKRIKTFSDAIMDCLAAVAQERGHSETMELLQKIDTSLIVNLGDNAKRLLSVYADKGDVAQLHEVFDYLLENKYVNTKDVDDLIPLLDVHLNANDNNAAVDEFVRISKLFKKLPKKFVLTCKLIEDGDAAGAERITEASNAVIGEDKTIFDLAHCFIYLGKKQQAKKLFETPGLRCIEGRLEYIFDQILKNKDPQKCEDLVLVSRSLHGSDRDGLYKKLVATFDASSQPEKVEDVWVQIQEEGHIPSDSLLSLIATILQKHDRKVPFEIPASADTDSAPSKSSKPNDDKIRSAMGKGQYQLLEKLVMESFKDDSSSLKVKREAIEFLIKNEGVKRAARIATELSHRFEYPQKISFKHLYSEISKKLGEKDGEVFLNGLKAPLPELLELENNSSSPSIQALLNEDKLEEAANRLLEICNQDERGNVAKKNIPVACELFKKWEAKGQFDDLKMFIEKLNERSNYALQTTVWYKTMIIRADPKNYLNLMKETPAEDFIKKFLITSNALLELSSTQPSLISELEALSSQGHAPASILLGKLSVHNGDAETLLKYFELSSSYKNAYIFDKIDSLDKMEMALNVAGTNQECVNQIVKNCLNYHKGTEKYDDIVKIGLERGVPLRQPKPSS